MHLSGGELPSAGSLGSSYEHPDWESNVSPMSAHFPSLRNCCVPGIGNIERKASLGLREQLTGKQILTT